MRLPVRDLVASRVAVALIVDAENYLDHAYPDDRGTDKVWTIGFGETEGVKKGDTTTVRKSFARLMSRIEAFERDIRRLVKVTLTQGEFDALVSFVYNVGPSAFAGSTLLRKINAGDYAVAADEFTRWRFAGGVELAGLVLRRAREREIFRGGLIS